MHSLADDTEVHCLRRANLSLANITDKVATVNSRTPTIDVLDLIFSDPKQRIIPVVDKEIPVGLISRQFMMEMFSRPYRRDLFGKHPIHSFMDPKPIIVDIRTDIDDISQSLIAAGLQQMLDGFLVVDEQGKYVGLGNAQDLLSEITKRKQEHLYDLAHYDALTRLPNRILFRDRLEMAIKQAERCSNPFAVVFIDLDQFKRINDTLGHPIGDELLRVVSRRISQAIRSCDTLARMGGDEFTLVLTNLVNAEDAALVVRKLRENLKEPIELTGSETVITASIGIAVYPDDGEDSDELLRKADIALYAAKRAGRDTYRFFDKTHDAFDGSRLFLEQELRRALQHESIEPVFQGIVQARNGVVVGTEALARWNYSQKGMIPPSTFVPLAEDTGLIKQLGQNILRSVVSHAKTYFSEQNLKLSVNLSVREIRSKSFVDVLFNILDEAAFPPNQIQLEITERLFIEPSEEILSKLERLRKAGILIAIDDFGVGSTSLSLLHILPIDVIKIDRSFIAGMLSDPRVEALVKAMINMGHALDLEIVAEGVENREQALKLTELGCDYLQGYLFCQPIPAKDFRGWLQTERGASLAIVN